MLTKEQVEKVKEIVNAYPQSTVIFEYLAARRRLRDFVELIRFYRRLGHAIDKETFYKVFNELEKQGFGRIVKGRFVFTSSLIQIGKAGSTRKPPIQTKKSDISMLVIYVLRSDFRVGIRLPVDFSKEEAIKIADFIRHFPEENHDINNRG